VTDVLGWLDQHNGTLIAALTFVLVVVTGWYARTTQRMADLAHTQMLNAVQPVVVFESVKQHAGLHHLAVQVVNLGQGPALGLSIVLTRAELPYWLDARGLTTVLRLREEARVFLHLVEMEPWVNITGLDPGNVDALHERLSRTGVVRLGTLVASYSDAHGRAAESRAVVEWLNPGPYLRIAEATFIAPGEAVGRRRPCPSLR